MHRSLVQPRFYREVVRLPRRQVIRFFITMLIFSSVIASCADMWYLLYGKRALPTTLSAAFPGLEIKNGTLHPHNGSPYSPPSYLIAPIFNQLFNPPTLLNQEAESLVVVDTATPPVVEIKIPMILMKTRTVKFIFNEKTSMEIPYVQMLSGKQNLNFTRNDILKHLKNQGVMIFIGYLITTIIHDGGMFLFSIFFLAFAAFIFRIERQRRFKEFIKVAVFAISPIVIGGILVAVSGVKIQWVWHILIFLSTVVMFRAIVALSNSVPHSGETT